MHQGAEADAGGAFGQPRPGLFEPGGAGDVEVNPGRVAHELPDEERAVDGAAAAALAGVADVSNLALDVVGVVVVKRHGPELFSGGARAGQECVEERLVVGKGAGVEVAEGDVEDRKGV